MIDLQKEISDLQTMYKEKTSSKLFSILLIGDSGAGKTRFLETCPRPIHIDSFDPNGTVTVRKGIEEGWIIADTRYEREDPTDPSAFELWDSEYERRKKGEYYQNFGTYCLDSFTMFSDAVMNLVLRGLVRKADRATKSPIPTDYLRIPQENDWPLQMTIIKNAITDILTLPCNVVVTGHLEDKKNKQGLILSKGLYATGRLALRLPRLFQEIYYLKTEETSKGIERHLITQPDGMIEARTRIGRDVFVFKEKPDMMYLLNKAGIKAEHKNYDWRS